MTDIQEGLEKVTLWLSTAGLYSPLTLNSLEALDLAEVVSLSFRIDCYCTTCRRESTFVFRPGSMLRPAIPGSISSNQKSETAYERALEYLRGAFGSPDFSCTRVPGHRLKFHLLCTGVEEEGTITLMKIGQWPSQFDLIGFDLQRYKRLLGDTDLRELKAAEICTSAGFHVAAYTYLRRVFERRIEVAHQQALQDIGWDEVQYKRAFFMEQKIDQLHDHLPAFLVENRKIYNILSQGIHELSEAECEAGYRVVRAGVTLILDEEVERLRRTKNIAEAQRGLQQLQDRLRKP